MVMVARWGGGGGGGGLSGGSIPYNFKLMPVFYVSVLLLMINFVITYCQSCCGS